MKLQMETAHFVHFLANPASLSGIPLNPNADILWNSVSRVSALTEYLFEVSMSNTHYIDQAQAVTSLYLLSGGRFTSTDTIFKVDGITGFTPLLLIVPLHHSQHPVWTFCTKARGLFTFASLLFPSTRRFSAETVRLLPSRQISAVPSVRTSRRGVTQDSGLCPEQKKKRKKSVIW